MNFVFRPLLALTLLVCGGHAMASERLLPPSTPEAGIASLMMTAEEQGTVKVIVGLRVPFAPEGTLSAAEANLQRADIARAAAAFEGRFAAAVQRNPASFRSYASIPYAAIEVTPEELERLSKDPEVVSITINRVARTQLADSVPMVRADEAQLSGFSGAGQTVAVIDTGVDKTHPFLAGRVVAEACFSSGGWCPGGAAASTAPGSGMPCPDSGCSHGTHAAGIIAGQNSGFSGVAPQANLIAVQVFSDSGVPGSPTANWSDVIAALDYVNGQRNTFSIAAVNLGLGDLAGPYDCGGGDPAMDAAFATLRSNGIASVVASGNTFYSENLSTPACLPSAISVGAVSTRDWGNCQGHPNLGPTARDKVACYSNSSPALSLLAPGSPVNSAVPDKQYAVHHGTSAAAAHVAGAFAMLRQKKPDATVEDMLDTLQITGVTVADYRNGREKKRIDAKAALDFIGTPVVKLSYTSTGRGSGAIRFSPAGTESLCRASCVNGFTAGTTVTLTAAPLDGSSFGGWSGACSGTAACILTMSEARSVTAAFEPSRVALTYEKTGDGDGHVSFLVDGRPSDCSTGCVQSYETGTVVTILPYPAVDSIFEGWSGTCKGEMWCRTTMSEAQRLSARFGRLNGSEPTLTFESDGTGQGSAIFLPVGRQPICDRTCVNTFRPGTLVGITPVPADKSVFARWSGPCTLRGQMCIVEMDEAKTVTATFNAGTVPLTYSQSGNGSGAVSLSPEGTPGYCTEHCVSYFSSTAFVTLTATAAQGSVFAGWTGDCSGAGSCLLSMAGPRSVTATFELAALSELPLLFKKSGNGRGAVTFTPAGSQQSCSADCTNVYPAGSIVTVSPTPAAGSVFAGWSGACSGMGACQLTMSETRTLTASFEPRPGTVPLTYSKSGTGGGVVRFTPEGENASCAESCVNSFAMGARVRVRIASVDPGSTFAGWTGACRGKGSCTVRMNAGVTVGAIFNARPVYTLSYVKAGTGNGTVAFSPQGNPAGDCSFTCSRTFVERTRVTVRAAAAPGSVFTGWSGACKGKRTCSVTMSSARSVTATFATRVSASSAGAVQ